MGALNRYYLALFKEDDFDLKIDIINMIDQFSFKEFYNISDYDKLIYKIKWPEERERQALSNAQTECQDLKPILLKGVIIDNPINKSTGMRCLYVVDSSQFENHNTTDESWVLHLRNVENVIPSIHAYAYRTDFTYSISLDNIRPGTEVILALANLKVVSESNKTISAYCTDVILDEKYELTNCEFVDPDYKLHGADEYLKLYKGLRDKIKQEKRETNESQATSSSEGCYIATAVYGSYDCPEVWTLRRYRDTILASTNWGKLFIKIYYAISPALVKWFGKTKWFQCLWKKYLDKLVYRLQNQEIEDSRYSDNFK